MTDQAISEAFARADVKESDGFAEVRGEVNTDSTGTSTGTASGTGGANTFATGTYDDDDRDGSSDPGEADPPVEVCMISRRNFQYTNCNVINLLCPWCKADIFSRVHLVSTRVL